MSDEEKAVMLDLPTSQGTITFVSRSGDPQPVSAFASAMNQFEQSQGKTAGEAFDALPQGAMATMRKGFETVTAPIRQALPQVGQAVGGIAGTSPALMLAAKLGLIPGSTANAPIQAGRAIGSVAGDIVSEPLKTPGNFGAAVGTAAATPFTAPVTGATGALKVLPLIRNMATVGAAGAAGYNAGALATGGEFDPGKTAIAFATTAASEGLRGVIGHWIDRYVSPNMKEDTAKGIIDTFKERYPALANDPRFMDVTAEASPQLMSRLSQKMASSLRDSVDDVTTQLVTDIKGTLPRNLTSAQSRLLGQHARSVAEAQNAVVDALGNQEAMTKAQAILATKANELMDFVRSAYPGIKNIEPTAVRVGAIMKGYENQLQHFNEGAQVLSLLKESGAAKGWNPMDFAQRIRGDYQGGNTMLQQIGNILGGGRPLTEMPAAQAPPTADQWMQRGVNFLRDQLPIIKHLPGAAREAPVPWPAPASSNLPVIPGIAISESGNAAMQSYMGKK